MPDLIRRARVKVNGTALTEERIANLYEIFVESSLYVPNMFEMIFHDDHLELIDGSTFNLGSEVEIAFDDGNPRTPQMVVVIKGEITGLEPEFVVGGSHTRLIVRGYDKSHRLYRGVRSEVYLNAKDSDIASQIAGHASLSPQVEATTEVFKHVYQNAQTDMEFLRRRAERIGYEVYAADGKLFFRKPDPTGASIATLKMGEELVSFRPRLSLASQVEKVTVRGWDVQKKEAIVGQATTSKTAPEIGLGKWGGQAAQTAFSAAQTQVFVPVQSQSDANAVAKSILDEVNSAFIEAEGEALGNPALKAGEIIQISDVGTRFSGKYKLTTVRHIFVEGDYRCFFAISGSKPMLVTETLQSSNGDKSRWAGVYPAIVTNNKSESDWGMVKVKYPWLEDKIESYWARLASPGGGAQRGIYFLPEVNDEVLVAFEAGDFNRPYIIGGLYNGKDQPPEAIGNAVSDGNVETRTIKTRIGHLIRLTDKSGSEKIEIIDSKQNTQLIMDMANKKVTIESEGDIELKATKGKILLSSKQIEMSSQMDTKVSAGTNYELSGKAGVKIETPATLNMKATGMATLEGTGPTTVKSAAILTIQGSLVKIN